jgi:clan AA aspartic protease (TIGR02281 family)
VARSAQNEPAFEPTPPVSVPCAPGRSRCRVRVTVNGTQLDLVVDTGAQITVLWEDAASQAGLSPGSNAPIIPVRGVTGRGVARLVQTTIDVGGLEESGIIVAVMPGSRTGADGLLGMSYLSRFRTSMAGDLKLQPLDAADPHKIGGHGRAYWSHRFRDVANARVGLERMLRSARDLDQQIAAQIGVAPGEMTVEDRVEAMKAFVQELDDALWSEAGRHDVPKNWRR